MAELTVSNARLREGVWRAMLVGAKDGGAPPAIEVVHQGLPLEGVRLAPDGEMPGVWTLKVPIPATLISDGVQTFLLRDVGSHETLASFSIASGAPLEADLRADLDLLRAELDLLKKAFRRHCVETASN